MGLGNSQAVHRIIFSLKASVSRLDECFNLNKSKPKSDKVLQQTNRQNKQTNKQGFFLPKISISIFSGRWSKRKMVIKIEFTPLSYILQNVFLNSFPSKEKMGFKKWEPFAMANLDLLKRKSATKSKSTRERVIKSFYPDIPTTT